jgi:hypothetical protein
MQMPYQQKEYYIHSRDNEYYKILSIINYRLKEAHDKGNYPVWGEMLDKLKAELEANAGENLEPWHYNMIIKILLEFVPDSIKDDY